MQYYYFAASLPMLSMGDRAPFSWEEWLSRCEEALSREDMAAMHELHDDLTGAPRHPFVRRWRDLETQLRNAIVKARAARRKTDPTPYLHFTPSFEQTVDQAVADAYSRESPLEREQALDRFRWSQAERLAGYDAFSTEAVLSYSLQLRIAERWENLDASEGQERVNTIVQKRPGDRAEGSDSERGTEDQ